MRAVQIHAYDGKPESITVAEVPVPKPGAGEVLVKVHASPVNPSDLAFLQGLYGFKKPLPAIPGFEGSGTVIESGAGMMARFLKGRRVACAAADANVAVECGRNTWSRQRNSACLCAKTLISNRVRHCW